MNQPCYKCNKRVLGCHDWCPEYRQYRADTEVLNESRRKYMDARSTAVESSIRKVRYPVVRSM